MSQVKIVTDSNAHLPDPGLIAELDIEVVPLIVRMGAQAYPERINFTDEADGFFEINCHNCIRMLTTILIDVINCVIEILDNLHSNN